MKDYSGTEEHNSISILNTVISLLAFNEVMNFRLLYVKL